jgi:hypothetical protein
MIIQLLVDESQTWPTKQSELELQPASHIPDLHVPNEQSRFVMHPTHLPCALHLGLL